LSPFATFNLLENNHYSKGGFRGILKCERLIYFETF
jgi:hypothetical protein